MKKNSMFSLVIGIINLAVLSTAGCTLFYNPDFLDKTYSVDSMTNTGTTTQNSLIVPGNAVVTGTYAGPFKLDGVSYTLDGSTSRVATLNGKSWQVQLDLTNPGVHSLDVTLHNAAGIDTVYNYTLNVPVYIKTNGSDTNSGATPASAKLSIQRAVDSLSNQNQAHVYVQGGLYTSGAGLTNIGNSALQIINKKGYVIKGGYNTDYSLQTDYSYFRGNGSIYHILFITNSQNISADKLVLTAASANVGVSGGGLYIYNSTNITIVNCVVSNNNAQLQGGGMFLSLSSKVTVDAQFISNIANTFGGGVSIQSSEHVTLTGSFMHNSALNSPGGGGIYINSSKNLNMSGTVSRNYAAVNGGGLYLTQTSNLTLTASIISNQALNDGGGLYDVSGQNNNYTGNINFNNVTNLGGGCFVSNSTAFSLNSTFLQNSAQTSGGALYDFNTKKSTFVFSMVSNISSMNGGGIYSFSVVSNSYTGKIAFSTSTWGGGYAAYNSSNCSFNLDLVSNTSSNSGGGAFYMFCFDGTITGKATFNKQIDNLGYGGGFVLYGCSNLIVQNILTALNTANGIGGGMEVIGTSGCSISGSFYSNTALYGGGISIGDPFSGVQDLNSQFNTEVFDNKAAIAGGGIYIGRNSDNNQFAGNIYRNTATNGAGIYTVSNYNNTVNASIYNNTSISNGGGIYLNCVSNWALSGNFSANTASNTGAAVFIRNYNTYPIDFKLSNLVMTNSSALGLNYPAVLSVDNGFGGGGALLFTITNCYFGGIIGNKMTAFSTFSFNLGGFKFINNKFIRNSFTNLYYRGTGPVLISTNNIISMNDPGNLILAGAASGNVMW